MPCNSVYCINGTGTYDGNYGIAPTLYNGYEYFSGDTLPAYYIYYNSGSTEPSWCLSTSLGGSCLLFGKSPCLSSCPDLCDDFFGPGPCPTPTPTPTAACDVDFDAFFDCGITPTPTTTPTSTPTSTPTPTPTPTNPCGGISLVVTAITVTPTVTPTPSITPSQTPDITRPCNFTGKVTFNTIDDFLRCQNSKKFRDCTTGFLFYTSDVILDEFGIPVSIGIVYRTVINGASTCVVYDGLVENISGADDILIIETIGPEINGSCLNCFPIASQTPTPTPTITPTQTTSAMPMTCINYIITNLDPLNSNTYSYKDCDDVLQSVLISPSGSLSICASVVPINSTFTISTNGSCVTPSLTPTPTVTPTILTNIIRAFARIYNVGGQIVLTNQTPEYIKCVYNNRLTLGYTGADGFADYCYNTIAIGSQLYTNNTGTGLSTNTGNYVIDLTSYPTSLISNYNLTPPGSKFVLELNNGVVVSITNFNDIPNCVFPCTSC